MRIWDKSGNPLTDQIQFDTFFNFASGAGDPIVLYDHAADRWLLTEFKSKTLGIAEDQHELYLAVSTTPDPLGTYHTYTVYTPGFPDYPHYSMWSDMYLVTTNESACGFYALDRTSMLAGNPTNAQRFETPDIGLGFLAGAPVHWDGDTPPPAGKNAIAMRMKDDGWNGVATDALEFWELDIDFDTSANSSLSLVQELSVSPFDTQLCGYNDWACIEQPNGGELLDPLLEILMNRVQYRNFGTHESIVCCHTTDVNTTDRAGIRWYELRRTDGDWSVHQEGTYSPDDAGRFMGSIAMDDEGNIALGFNISSTTIFPSIRYTGRDAGSPLGQMTWGETSIQEGTGTHWSNRYGDYNQLVWDPASDSFWMTAMYNNTENWKTRVAQFSSPFVISGCMDSSACIYDSEAITDDESCLFGEATVTILTDTYPTETTWVLTDNTTGDLVASGGPYSSPGITEASALCLAVGCYTFTISDQYGDGICCLYGDGAYSVTNVLGETLASGGEFGSSDSTEICICIPQLWYEDSDSDGFGDIDPNYQATSCEMPTVTNNGETFTSAILIGGDCNDGDANVFPRLWYDDYDGDGFGDISPDYQATSCEVPTLTNDGSDFTQAILIGGDCNDEDASTFPGSAEIDSDNFCMKDSDNDGYGDNSAVANALPWVTDLGLQFPESQLYDGTDCDDDNDSINPGAIEILNNGIDENCDWQDAISICGNGIVEPGEDCDDANSEGNDGCFDCQTFSDDDGDGYYADLDCDDSDPYTFPGAAENESATACMTDADGDGYGSDVGIFPGTDCNDYDDSISPGAEEVCDSQDNNCNGDIDEETDFNDNGICDADEVEGCMEETACNYNMLANVSGGNCIFPDNADFSYLLYSCLGCAQSQYCQNAGIGYIVTQVTGLAGGEFTSTDELSMDPSTGAINIWVSAPDTYSVTYTTNGACPNSSTVEVTIIASDDASFSYPDASYCACDSDPEPTITGLAGGEFASTDGLSLDPSTGTIDLSNSTIGTYTVTYLTEGDCLNESTFQVTINYDCEGNGPLEGYDCDGNCLSDNDGDLICDEFEVVGCMNVDACNYNEFATDSGGNCITMASCPCELEGQQSATLSSLETSDPLVQIADITDLYSIEVTLEFASGISGPESFYASDLAMAIYSPSGECVSFGGYDSQPSDCQNLGGGLGDVFWPLSWAPGPGGEGGSTNGTHFASVDLSAADLSGSGEWSVVLYNGYEQPEGVTTTASFDVSWVIYHNGIDNDGDGVSSCEGDCDDGDAFLNTYDLDGDGVSSCEGDCDDSDVPGCNYPQACNYDEAANTDDGSCIFAEDCETCDSTGGISSNDVDQDGVCDDDEVPGCLDAGYMEFNPNATDDNGSCDTPIVDGCTYDNAENYNSSANNDNGTCTFGSTTGSGCGSIDCPDLDCDGQVGVADLIGLLAGFDTLCGEVTIEEWDCPELLSNFGDPCDIPESKTGDIGIIMDDCNCEWAP